MEYKVGRGNLACTIFVPFDCDNNCPFCTSKAMYKELGDNVSLDKILWLIMILNDNPNIKEYVITGGEPFANLEMLDKIVSCMDKPIYINTTLPKVNEERLINIINYINTNVKISGVNISRHIGFNFRGVADIDEIKTINKPIRINTVINKNFTFEGFLEFVKQYGGRNRLINLRADYTTITNETLKCRDNIDNFLLDNFEYIGSTSCMVCNSEKFVSEDFEYHISYHRGLEHSSFVVGNKKFINDIIITPDGGLFSDWDKVEDKEFNSWILNI